MVLMALDHARDYFSPTLGNPENLSTTTPALFLTRWITHFCAPTFVLLAGVAAWLYGSRQRSRVPLARFLFTRGLWLIVLELTVITYGWFHSFALLFWQVFAAIGVSMIALSGLVFLPRLAIATIGLVLVGLHNLLDPITLESAAPHATLWRFLHEGIFPNFGLETVLGRSFLVVYPVLPWIGVMTLGYALGPVVQAPREERRRALLRLGVTSTLAFVALRSSGLYGEPLPWQTDQGPVFSALSFLACTKYPPSLAFLLMTLGPALILLAALDRDSGRVGRALETLGSVPLFYYIVHLYVIHAGSRLLHLIRFGEPVSALQAQFVFLPQLGITEVSFQPFPEDYVGLSLPGLYVAWIAIVVAIYPLCRRYARWKRASSSWLASYL